MFKRLKSRVSRFIFSAAKAAVQEALLEDSYNIERQIQRIALQESAQYVLRNIEIHKVYPDRYALMERCLTLIPSDGLILEFGVYTGRSIRHIAKRLPDRQIFGFDSFEGLREPWVFAPPGLFADVDRLPSVPRNVTLIKGFFEDTTADFLGNHPETIALLHIDSDLYSSCKCVLEACGQRIRPQSVIVFDDFFNDPNWMDGEFKAFSEWCNARGVKYEFIGFTAKYGIDSSGHQVAVKILSLDGQMAREREPRKSD